MTDTEILEAVAHAKKSCGKCAKFAGALTVEVLRRALEEEGICVSARDVFIQGVPTEIDLLVPRADVVAEHGLLYAPEDVLVVLEIKNYGSFGEPTIGKTKDDFRAIHQRNAQICCAYVTLEERKGYKWAVSDENLGFPTYTLFWHSGSGAKYTRHPTGDWERLLRDIKDVIHAKECASAEAIE